MLCIRTEAPSDNTMRPPTLTMSSILISKNCTILFYPSSTYNMNAQGINQYTVPATSTYQQNSALKIKVNNIDKPLITWITSMGQACRQNYVPITEGVTTSTCIYSILNAEACQSLNADLVGSNFLFC